MRSFLLAVPFVAMIGAVSAQSSAAPRQFPVPSPDVTVSRAQTDAENGCPVGMSAKRKGGGQVIWAIALEDKGRPDAVTGRRSGGPGVHVELQAHDQVEIRQVSLAVDFLAPGGRVLPVGSKESSGDLSKTFELTSGTGASLRLVSDLYLGPVAGVKRVRLLSIVFADGTSWAATYRAQCSVQPSGLMLVE